MISSANKQPPHPAQREREVRAMLVARPFKRRFVVAKEDRFAGLSSNSNCSVARGSGSGTGAGSTINAGGGGSILSGGVVISEEFSES
jgi:hypothetical protein